MRIRFVAMSLASCVLASACGGGGPGDLPILIKRVALNLAFEDEELAGPKPEPRVIIRRLPAAPNVLTDPGSPPPPPNLGGFDFLPPCPEAKANAHPKEAVTIQVKRAPAEGLYTKHNKGVIRITGTAVPLTLPYPPFSTMEIRNVATEVVASGRPGTAPTEVGTFETVDDLFGFKVLRFWRYDADSIDLQREEVGPSDGVIVSDPEPDLTFMTLNQGTGNTWNSAGIDSSRNSARLIQGQIEDRALVDVCGEVFDSWRVRHFDTSTDLTTAESSGTDPEDGNKFWVATQFGGIVISEQIHYTRRLFFDGQPVNAEFEYVSTLDSLVPR